MPNFAHAVVMGHVGQEPEVRATQSGTEVCTFSIGCNTGYGDRKKTTWWKAVCFGKTGQVAAGHISKGDPVQVSGEPSLDEWQDRDGNKRSTLTITVNQLVLMGERKAEPERTAPVRAAPVKAAEPFDDEIPF